MQFVRWANKIPIYIYIPYHALNFDNFVTLRKKYQPHFERSSSGHYNAHKNAILIILIFKRLSGHPTIVACFSLDEYIFYEYAAQYNAHELFIIKKNCMAGVWWGKKKKKIQNHMW